MSKRTRTVNWCEGRIIRELSKRQTLHRRGRTKMVEADRRKAIRLAIETARKDDIVLIAGKGHENYQIIGTKKSHFSDKEIALEYLAETNPNG